MKPSTRFIFTALAYLVPTMIWGMLWHFTIFPSVYEEFGIYNRTEPIIPLGFTSMILQSIIMALLFPYYKGEKKGILPGIYFSLLMGIFLYSVSTLANAAKIEVSSMQNWLLIQLAFHFLQFLTAGLFIGLVNRK